MAKHTLAVLVENSSGVLARVASLFARRAERRLRLGARRREVEGLEAARCGRVVPARVRRVHVDGDEEVPVPTIRDRAAMVEIDERVARPRHQDAEPAGFERRPQAVRRGP